MANWSGFSSGFIRRITLTRRTSTSSVSIRNGAVKASAGTCYELFFEQAREASRTTVKAITSPRNTTSIAYHTALDFSLEPGDTLRDGLPVHTDYDGPGEDRVCFVRRLR